MPADHTTGMARTWLSIRVDLIEGAGRTFWPRPGRVFAAARTHTFTHLGDAIDTAFARWDRSHLTLFHLADGSDLYGPIRWEDPWEGSRFAGDQKLSRLAAGEQCIYTFDMGDDWTHLCTVAEQRIDPLDTLGVIPAVPLPYWGWGQIPDQYGRLSEDDEEPLGPDPDRQDLPPLHPYWGPRQPAPPAPVLPALDVAAARHFCEQRIPPHALDQLRLELQQSPGAMTIVERRAPWREDFGPEWSTGPVAQLRYSTAPRLWTLHCRDRHQRWHRYDPLPSSPDILVLLDEIDRDPTCIFWG